MGAGAPFANFTILAAGHDFVEVSFRYSELNISNISTNNMESCTVNYTNIQVFVNCTELNQTFALIVTIDTFDGLNYTVLADLEPSPPTVSSGKWLDERVLILLIKYICPTYTCAYKLFVK